MSARPLLIVGAGSFASEVGNLARETGRFEPVAFLDTRLDYAGGKSLDGLPVLSLATVEDLALKPAAVCALGTTLRGDDLAHVLPLGLEFTTLIHPTAHIPESVELEPGVIIGAGVIVGHATTIGSHAIVNRGALIGHHTQIGTLAIVSPGANVAARVSIGERVYLGIGAIVIDGRSVGERCVVGAGAVVVRDLPERVQAVGMPARIVKKDIDGL
ncbi:MAG: NeuD/PglB/VioB family sugar acetyltransferase [Thiohalocapsa sp. PB-PSB1]|jgi:acetyltransferase EpsM|nr:MAG: hypothetical protein N838_04285 [Thiohalocapsa sp. PB-PSB1]QQO55360.1 MAG: NeuD/PglB/VioB family sugar acetyltransferase [Thiohalocapsa sp. PB-PSB1]HCS90687.1 acetyltransferase [Chromatiaceae bacterium]